MELSSVVESSCRAQAGSTTIGLKNPMAVGTCRRSDTHTFTERNRCASRTVARSAGSSASTSTELQLRRNARRCQIPNATRNSAKLETNAQAPKRYIAHEPGALKAARAGFDMLVVCERLNSGRAAMASNALNQTANLVPELRFPSTFKTPLAKSAIANPPVIEFRTPWAESCASC